MYIELGSGKKDKTKRKRHFSDYIVYISIFMIVSYTMAAVALQFKGLMEISSTLTVSWYTFWTTEIIVLATIKNTKVKQEKEKITNENHEENHSKSER